MHFHFLDNFTKVEMIIQRIVAFISFDIVAIVFIHRKLKLTTTIFDNDLLFGLMKLFEISTIQ